MKPRILVLGLGSIGMRHAHNFKHLGCHVAGFDPTLERRSRFESEVSPETFDNEDNALEQGADLVVVASPNIFHLPQSIKVAQRGLPLFIEKPLGTNLKQARELAALLKENKIYAHMGSNWKFHPAFIKMKSIIETGGLGHIRGINVMAGQWLPDWHPWEDYRQMYAARKDLGGGAIFDTHELDYMTWLLGPVSHFHGHKIHSASLDIETEDVAGCVMTFHSGAIGTLLTDYIQRIGRRAYVIFGDEATLRWTFSDGKIWLDRPGAYADEAFDVNLDDLNNSYIKQSQHILDDLKDKRDAITGIDRMIEVLELQHRWHE